jgi:hypothetical protein
MSDTTFNPASETTAGVAKLGYPIDCSGTGLVLFCAYQITKDALNAAK